VTSSRTYTLGYEHREFYRHVIAATAFVVVTGAGLSIVPSIHRSLVWLALLPVSVLVIAWAVWHLARTRVVVSEEGIQVFPFGLLGRGQAVTRQELLAGLVMPDNPTIRLELVFRHEQSVILGPFDPISGRTVEREVDALTAALVGHGLKVSDLRRPMPED